MDADRIFEMAVSLSTERIYKSEGSGGRTPEQLRDNKIALIELNYKLLWDAYKKCTGG